LEADYAPKVPWPLAVGTKSGGPDWPPFNARFAMDAALKVAQLRPELSFMRQ
jgi:hypothetical protein